MGPVVAIADDDRIIPLCVPLDAADDNNIAGGSSSTSSSFRIVGTVTLRGRSAVVPRWSADVTREEAAAAAAKVEGATRKWKWCVVCR